MKKGGFSICTLHKTNTPVLATVQQTLAKSYGEVAWPWVTSAHALSCKAHKGYLEGLAQGLSYTKLAQSFYYSW